MVILILPYKIIITTYQEISYFVFDFDRKSTYCLNTLFSRNLVNYFKDVSWNMSLFSQNIKKSLYYHKVVACLTRPMIDSRVFGTNNENCQLPCFSRMLTEKKTRYQRAFNSIFCEIFKVNCVCMQDCM